MKLFLKRLIATLCDFTLLITLDLLISEAFNAVLNLFLKDNTNFIIGIFMSFFPMILSYLILLFIQIVIGVSIGKWLLNLKLRTNNNTKPSIRNLVLRDILKYIFIPTIIGPIVTIASYFTDKIMWYDKMLGFDVIDTSSGSKDLEKMFRR